MPLIFSPLSDDLIALPPRILFPRQCFVMKQIGTPPKLDTEITGSVEQILIARNFKVKDAGSSTGSKDYLERILGLIRGTGITIAIFSHQTRPSALANIMLELGFAAMCGKPLMIIKSVDADAPSDLKRTDWIDFNPADPPAFEEKVNQALDAVDELAEFEEQLLDISLDAASMDCAIAFERVQRAFLLSGEPRLLDKAKSIADRLLNTRNVDQVDDLNRLHNEVALFLSQGRKSILA